MSTRQTRSQARAAAGTASASVPLKTSSVRKRKSTAVIASEPATAVAPLVAAEPATSEPATTAEPAPKRTKTTAVGSKKKGKKTSTATDDANGEWKFGTVSREYEEKLRAAGKTILIGVDEAGRGPLAGPVVAAAVYVPTHVHFEGVNDSKILTEPQRESLFASLTTHPDVVHAVCILEHTVIDRINILAATLQAMETCTTSVASQLASRGMTVQHVLVDGNRLPAGLAATHSCEAVVKGDGRVYSIAAASILAKVTRDRIMMTHHETWPEYNFAGHKGYGVAAHMSAIHRHGPCPIHRLTFAPMKHMKAGKEFAAAIEAEQADQDANDDSETTTETKTSAKKKKGDVAAGKKKRASTKKK